MRNCELADEAAHRDDKTTHDEWSVLLDVVRPEGDDQRSSHAWGIDWNRQQLCVAYGIAHFLEHGGDRGSEAVGADATCPERDNF
jgi:hypothetical protein